MLFVFSFNVLFLPLQAYCIRIVLEFPVKKWHITTKTSVYSFEVLRYL